MPPPWIDAMRRASIAEVARALGLAADNKYIATCPACGQARPVDSRGRPARSGGRGCGIRHGRGWRCFSCDASGDQIDLVARTLESKRFRELSDGGRARVREWCVRYTGAAAQSHVSRPLSPSSAQRSRSPMPAPILTSPDEPEPVAEPEPRYPSKETLRALASQLVRVDEVESVANYLRKRRGVDPTTIADLSIVTRAIPDAGPPLPSWASYGGRSWRATGHRMIVTLVDTTGTVRTVLARYVGDDKSMPKSLPPSGGYQRSGLVIACPLARRMLKHGTHPSQWPNDLGDWLPDDWWPATQPLTLVICEGEICLPTWLTEWSDAALYAPATIGILSGSWRKAYVDRIPPGTEVCVATDENPAGEKYAKLIFETLADRDDLGTVRRWYPPKRTP
jgi:hypothetical protein